MWEPNFCSYEIYYMWTELEACKAMFHFSVLVPRLRQVEHNGQMTPGQSTSAEKERISTRATAAHRCWRNQRNQPHVAPAKT
ncbi:hypothetical protein PoB_007136300 [Plakobranchus ocellatus]|uniref:Uncharacterized protein n=1 Tax=Plakobranchus ocellatus TaxID=259542 RepID=A0AAV4DLB9_9GAST|nr:hypothetical protein PoB_007136300 [Plakobranchus ocellatus]